MNIVPNFNQIFLIIALLGNIILAFVVYRSDPKSATNKIYTILGLVISAWLVASFFSVNPGTNLIWARFTIFFATLMSMLFFLFARVFPEKVLSLKKITMIMIFGSTFAVMTLTLTPFIFSGIKNSQLVVGPGIGIFAIITTFFTLATLFVIIRKIKMSLLGVKIQLKLILVGIMSMVSLLISTVMIPIILFKNDFFVAFIPLYALIFLSLAAYAIVKHHLFNIKVVLTEAITFVLWIVLFAKIFSADSLVSMIIDSVIFVVIFIFGTLLIRSVLREVKQREKIEALNKELEVANQKLQDLDKFKNQFFVQARHDLRTPVTAIMGYADLIISGTLGKAPKKIVEVAKNIEVSAQNMRTMAESFLDTAQFQLGKSPLQLKPGISLQSLLNEIVDQSKARADQGGIYLKFDKTEKDVVITADKEKLKSALSNIVGNAIKFTKQGGVDIKLSNDDKNAAITISDTGIGIPIDKIKTIFEQKFERTKQAQQTAEGKGVGLYLSGQIIKYHHGKAWAESPARIGYAEGVAGGAGEGKGSVFYIELPLKIDENISTEQSILTGKI